MSQKQHPSTKFFKIPFVLQRAKFRSAVEHEVSAATHHENQPETAKKQGDEEEKKKEEMSSEFWKRTN